MRLSVNKSGLGLGLALLLLLALTSAPGMPAQAAEADVAMFYDALEPYGSWVDYGNYGPVWYPTQGVTPNWRPYMDGRWVPTTDGWVFETSEPWGWATYHWGNWMPTTEYGWVWSPGSTWYPSTAAWRTSPEDTPVDNSYVGWAPIPPPDYVPEPAYAPATDYYPAEGGYYPPSGGYYPPGGGYYPGAGLGDILTAPFWIFAQAANFLLGWGQPFAPGYSYYNCGCLSPYNYTPVLFPFTGFVNDFCFFPFANRGFFAFGPGFNFVSRVTNVNIVNINNFARNANFNHFRNVMPPNAVLNRHPFLRDAVPAQVREGRGLQVQRVKNPGTVGRNLANPRVTPPPSNVPRLTKQIPRGATPTAQPAVRARGGAPGGQPAARGAGEVPVAPRGATAPKGVAAPGGAPATRGGREAPQVMTAPGRERAPATGHAPAAGRAPAHEVTAPTRTPTGHFTAPGRERAPIREQAPAARTPSRGFQAPSREFRAPSRGTTMPPPSTHELTPSMQRQIRQFQAPSRPAPSFHAPSAPRMAPSMPTPHAAPSAPRMAPSAPAPRPSAPAPHPSAPAPAPNGGGGGAPAGGHHR